MIDIRCVADTKQSLVCSCQLLSNLLDSNISCTSLIVLLY